MGGQFESMPTMMALTPLVPEATGAWRPVCPKGPESFRWESTDGRWIIVAVGDGAELGTMFVAEGERRWGSRCTTLLS